jgi:Holliday junction resolvasome RuvABC endonuclease subunit
MRLDLSQVDDLSDVAIVGIDPDTVRVTCCVTRVEGQRKPEIHKFQLNSDSNHVVGCGEAFRQVGSFLYELRQEVGLTVAYLEAPIMGQGGPGPTISQAQIGGAIMAAAEEYEIPLTLVNNQSWKKRVCGAGNINKEEVAKRMKDIWPEAVKIANGDQNAIDASAINLFGRKALALRVSIMKRRSVKVA